MKGAAGAEEVGGEFNPDGPASSPSSTALWTLGRTTSWGLGTSSVTELGAGTAGVSSGSCGFGLLVGTTSADASGIDGAGSG